MNREKLQKEKKQLTIGRQRPEFLSAILEKLNKEKEWMNGHVTQEWKIITPEFAKEMLEKRNTINRILLDGTVNSYAKQMIEGKWKTNGETIILSEEFEIEEDGIKKMVRYLLNGQHRMASCVKCGIPFLALVVSGIPKSTFDSMDTGKVRAGKDALSATHMFDEYEFNGSEYALASAIVKKVLEFAAGRKGSHGSSSTRTAPSNQDIVSESSKNREIYASIIHKLAEWNKTISVEDSFKSSKRMIGWFMAWLIIFCGWSEGDVYSFFREVVDKKHKTENKETDPIEKLKEKIKTHCEKASRRGEKSPYTDINMFDFFARAWNAYIQKTSLGSMSRRDKCADFLQKEEYEAKLKKKEEKLERAFAMA